MLQCFYVRQVWYNILLWYMLHRLTPDAASVEMAQWWTVLSDAVPRRRMKEINTLVTLVSRYLWLERNGSL
jgi:hypothetical protein